jgi:hypothetical protein
MEAASIITLALLGFCAGAIVADYYIKRIKKTIYWLNVYKTDTGFLFSDRLLCDTKREAIFDAGGRKDYVKTIKIRL